MQFRNLSDVSTVIEGAEVRGDLTTPITGFSTDSRTIETGEVFIALRGENFDGHDYIDKVGATASAAIVSRARVDSLATNIPLIVVDDPLFAYGEIARAHRRVFHHPVIAVAGSNGKTTTKELISAVLANRYNVLKTTGNLNNLIGVPATILKITDEHTCAVVEIGTNTPGEIARLCAILEPTHGIITNVGREHLELLGSIEGVAEEEGALFRYLDATSGVAFVNLDDPQLVRISTAVKGKVTYSVRGDADVRANVEGLNEAGSPILAIERKNVTEPAVIALQLPGMHNATNALAAAAVGLTLAVTLDEIKATLEGFAPMEYSTGYARLAPVRAKSGLMILNDTYNANPDSMLVAFDTLRAMPLPAGGRKIVVLGEMRELGASSAQEHADLGREIAESGGIDAAFLFGPEMKHAYSSLQQSKVNVEHFPDKPALIEKLRKIITPNDVVLVKGSRGTKMEEVVAALL